MRKVLCIFLSAVLMMPFFSVMDSSRADDVNERFEALYKQYDPNNDPDRINPSPLDERISRGSETRDSIISRKNAQEIHETKSRNSNSNRNASVQPSKGERRWQTGLQKWYNSNARYQLTNWTFSKDEVTVQLLDRNGNVKEYYTIYPYEPGNVDAGFQFGQRVEAGTQIVVPEGCQIHGDPAHVNSSSNPAKFNQGNTMYFETTDDGPGFTIFPYHAGRWRAEAGL